MSNLLTINHPFRTVEDFRRTAGQRLASLIHRLAGKYPHPAGGRASKRMLLALSVAWALTALAKAGDNAAFEHIDEALSPGSLHGCVCMPQGGCVVVEGVPFYIAEGEQAVLHFLWDGFTIFIDHEGTACVGQHFFDFADARQSKAYSAMGEDAAQSADLPSKPADLPSKPMPQPQPPTKTAPAPQPQAPAAAPQPKQRNYLEEMVQGVVVHGDEKAVRDLLANFSYIEHNDSHTDRLRGILLHRLEEMNRQKEAASGTTINYYASVGQAIGHANIENKTKEYGTTEQKQLQ